MTGSAGTRLGPYEVTARIGEGGMGAVYRARDTKLNRDVALKVLLPEVANDPERLARFRREAQTLAALNHPHIGAIYGLEESAPSTGAGQAGTIALVLELVEGPTLADRIARGPIPVDEALPVAKQIAEALEAAHEQGIIHRDLKPANIKVRDDGTVKVLDFGLAKALGADAARATADQSMSPTIPSPARTQAGMILGTAAYMAPEQAKGWPVDKRADIWAFGAVLYEMLAGRRAFGGTETADVLASVLRDTPAMDALPATAPARLTRLIQRCLDRDVKTRLRDIGEARIEIARLEAGAPDQAASQAPLWRRALPWTIAAIGVAVATVAWLGRAATSGGGVDTTATSGPTRLQIALPSTVDLFLGSVAPFCLAPDGRTLAFTGVRDGVRQAFIRRFDSDEVTPVRGSEGAASCVFSPDGREILVGVSEPALRRIRLADGFVTVVARNADDVRGAWLSEGRIVYAAGGRLFASGATPQEEPRQLTQPIDGSTSVEWHPASVPGRNAVAFVSGTPNASDSTRIEVLRIDDGTRKTIVEDGSGPTFTSTGHLLFSRDDDVLAVRFDADTLETVGDPVRVLSGVVGYLRASPLMAVSSNGTLVYLAASATESELVSVSRQGAEQLLLRMDRAVGNPRVSPSGERVLIDFRGFGLAVFDPLRKIESRLPDRIASNPVFGPGEREMIYWAQTGVFRQALDANTRPAHIPGTGPRDFPTSVTPDGERLLYNKVDPVTAADIYDIPLAGGTPRPIVRTRAYEGGAEVSPDGRWIVYASNERGQNEVFLQAYPTADRRVQVSSQGGTQPAWNPKGGEIFYRRGDDMLSVRVTFGAAGPALDPPVKLFTGHYVLGTGLTTANYSVMPDGDHFLMVKEPSRAILNVVLNWLEELKRLVPTR